ncbi:MAG: primosomal protein N' [Firmicutes bacterium]|nr:primosomal protein N' [Bacillota bacterium]
MKKFADIIINIHSLPTEHPFTYLIPEHLSEIAVGCRVLVPFGSRKVEGFCVRLHNQMPDTNTQLKTIIKVLDEQAVLTPELIALSTWAADYYLCKQVDFLAAMVPAKGRTGVGLRAKRVKTAYITEEGFAAQPKGKKQALALKLLRQNKSLTLSRLAQAGVSSATVRTLAQKGWVKIARRQVRRDPLADLEVNKEEPIVLTEAQKKALTCINKDVSQKPFLLFGVTGSGKTEIYLQAIAERLEQGEASIVLVPEIALTPQMTERFVSRFGDLVAVLHSRLSAGERYDEWCRVANGEALVVIGARSAVFAPVQKLGLIILDEEHESTYKQEERPHYHAREIALWRAKWHKATVILGSATPSLESYRNAQCGNYILLQLPERIADRSLPSVEIVDMRQELKDGHKSIFSRTLIAALQDTLQKKQQAILFLNRRGYATFVLCRECGHVMRCPDCNVSLKYHLPNKELCCHYCDFTAPYPDSCPNCRGRYIKYFGTGTQKVEAELCKQFPGIRVMRLDADTASKKGQYQKVLGSFKRQEADVLVGTQMIAKGHDFPNVTLVGVITADTALNLPDLRAGERTFQLLTQVAGRAGRGSLAGRVVVQTYTPEHYAILAAKNHDFEVFYAQESKLRLELDYPPFSFLIRLLISGENEGQVINACYFLVSALADSVDVLGPSPCPIEKVRGRYRWHILVRGKELDLIRRSVKAVAAEFSQSAFAGGVRLTLDVEPQNLL